MSDPLAVRLTPFIPHVPTPKQQAFLWLNCLEAMYGGAAGGGKSDALLMAALQYVDVAGYSAILFRRTFPDLNQPGSLIPRSKEWLAGQARWNENEHRWTFPSGATLTFGHLQYEDSKLQYQSAEFDFIAFDELTQFSETQYRYMFSRLRRRAESKVPPRMRAASNPGGPGHRWVKARLIDKNAEDDTPEAVAEAKARIFIRSGLADNPHLDRAEYRRALNVLDPQTRAQLLEGDWNAREPGDWVFPAYLDQVFALGADCDTARAAGELAPPAGGTLILAADWGVHSHLLLLWPLEAGGFYVLREFVYEHHAEANVRHVAPLVADAMVNLGWPVREERFDASAPILNAAFLERLHELVADRVKFVAVPFNKYKNPTIDYLRMLVANVGTSGQPPHLAVSEDGCPVLADQLRGWRYRDPDSGAIEKHDDHGPDALVAGAAPEAAKRGRRLNPTSERTVPVA